MGREKDGDRQVDRQIDGEREGERNSERQRDGEREGEKEECVTGAQIQWSIQAKNVLYDGWGKTRLKVRKAVPTN